jgi:hypothetical protein
MPATEAFPSVSRGEQDRAFIKRFLMHYGIYRRPDMVDPRVAHQLSDRRAAELGMKIKIGCHTFRATGITAYT